MESLDSNASVLVKIRNGGLWVVLSLPLSYKQHADSTCLVDWSTKLRPFSYSWTKHFDLRNLEAVFHLYFRFLLLYFQYGWGIQGTTFSFCWPSSCIYSHNITRHFTLLLNSMSSPKASFKTFFFFSSPIFLILYFQSNMKGLLPLFPQVVACSKYLNSCLAPWSPQTFLASTISPLRSSFHVCLRQVLSKQWSSFAMVWKSRLGAPISRGARWGSSPWFSPLACKVWKNPGLPKCPNFSSRPYQWGFNAIGKSALITRFAVYQKPRSSQFAT